MTIKDLWEKMLNADLIPIFQAFSEAVLWAGTVVLVLMLVLVAGLTWWVRKH